MNAKSPMRLTMKAFLPASVADFFVIPEADEEVRAEADAFPADEQHREVRAEHEDEHERREQVQVREVPRVFAVGLLVHVRGRVDVDQAADAGDDEDHHGRERIHAERERDVQVARRDPRVERHLDGADRARLPEHRDDGGDRRGKGADHGRARHGARNRLAQALAEKRVDEEAEERQQRDQRQHDIRLVKDGSVTI